MLLEYTYSQMLGGKMLFRWKNRTSKYSGIIFFWLFSFNHNNFNRSELLPFIIHNKRKKAATHTCLYQCRLWRYVLLDYVFWINYTSASLCDSEFDSFIGFWHLSLRNYTQGILLVKILSQYILRYCCLEFESWQLDFFSYLVWNISLFIQVASSDWVAVTQLPVKAYGCLCVFWYHKWIQVFSLWPQL